MENIVTVTLSPVAAKYLAEVVYSLDYGDDKTTTEQDAINYCLEELAAYEAVTDNQVTNLLMEEWQNTT